MAKRAEKVAAGLRELREPEAAAMVACLARDARRAAVALSALLEPVPKGTDWYEVHRNMWIRYGDPGDLIAMTENIAEVIEDDVQDHAAWPAPGVGG